MTVGDRGYRPYLNRGNALFVAGSRRPSAPSRAVALGDLDGDGYLDAFFGGLAIDQVALNDGNGVLIPTGQTLGAGPSTDVALGDLDGDGDLDAWIAKDHAQRVWLNDGTGAFHAAQFALGQKAAGVALGDFDLDGSLDAVEAGQTTRILLSRATPHWFWAAPTTDGPADSQTVTVSAFESGRQIASTRFDLIVENVAPQVEVLPLPESCPTRLVVVFEPTDPSPPDREAGFTIDFTLGGVTETALPPIVPRVPYSITIPVDSSLWHYEQPARIDVTDKDGGRTTLVQQIWLRCP